MTGVSIVIRNSEDGHHYFPGPFRDIQRYEGKLYCAEQNLPHPEALTFVSWVAVERALARTLDDFNRTRALPDPLGSPSCYQLLDSYSVLIARTAEFIETISKNVTASFLPPKASIRIHRLSSERREVDLMCNKIKHNQNFLVPAVGLMPDGTSVLGFSLYEIAVDGTQRPNQILHTKRDAFSFVSAIKRAITAAYLIGDNVSRFIAGQGSINPDRISWRDENEHSRFALLRALCALPVAVFPWENEWDMPRWTMTDGSLEIAPHGGNVLRNPSIRMTIRTIPLTGALSIQVPHGKHL